MSTVTVVPTVEASNSPPRVRLNITDTGTPNVTATTVTRLDPDGRTRPVRTADGNPLTLTTSGSNRVGLLYDYEVPFGAPVTYSTLESPTVLAAPVTVAVTRVWLIHPGVPELSTTITVAALGPRARKVQQGVFYPMGRGAPVVQTDGARKAAEYTLSVLTMTENERAKLDQILADAGPLLLNVPSSKGWGITYEYLAVGDVSENRQSPFAGEPLRVTEMACTVIERPVGGSQSERTYVDVLAINATYASLMPKYNTYLDLLAGP